MRLYERVLNKCLSYYVNRKIFPKEIARKMPIYIYYKVKIDGIRKGCIEIQSDNIYKGMIQIGIKPRGGVPGISDSYISFANEGKIIFKGKADLSRGLVIHAVEKARLIIGDNFFMNACCVIRCRGDITIGRDNMWGWCVVLLDGDGHPIYDKEHAIMNYNKGIVIGDNVWLGAYSKVLKGVEIKNGCVVGVGSIVIKGNMNEKSILVGTPAIEKKYGVEWSRENFED